MNFTEEQIAKAKQAKSAEELLALAKGNGIELTEEEAKDFFAECHKEGELSDEELDAVAGGKNYAFFDPKYTVGVRYDPSVGKNLCPNCDEPLSYVCSEDSDSGTFDVYKCDSCGEQYYRITSGQYRGQWRE